ncbi:hypothetical protein CEXT_525851 [Caerostris extrusa]|uniref:Uncharacterized protein n=1 Tax=Caerostris extrusa TaxID=172846 RepID=A0AAV4PDR2_CAEEX|nr:hypothetical protein CEXT_525851 [Caerostris extrusa]
MLSIFAPKTNGRPLALMQLAPRNPQQAAKLLFLHSQWRHNSPLPKVFRLTLCTFSFRLLREKKGETECLGQIPAETPPSPAARSPPPPYDEEHFFFFFFFVQFTLLSFYLIEKPTTAQKVNLRLEKSPPTKWPLAQRRNATGESGNPTGVVSPLGQKQCSSSVQGQTRAGSRGKKGGGGREKKNRHYSAACVNHTLWVPTTGHACGQCARLHSWGSLAAFTPTVVRPRFPFSNYIVHPSFHVTDRKGQCFMKLKINRCKALPANGNRERVNKENLRPKSRFRKSPFEKSGTKESRRKRHWAQRKGPLLSPATRSP